MSLTMTNRPKRKSTKSERYGERIYQLRHYLACIQSIAANHESHPQGMKGAMQEIEKVAIKAAEEDRDRCP